MGWVRIDRTRWPLVIFEVQPGNPSKEEFDEFHTEFRELLESAPHRLRSNVSASDVLVIMFDLRKSTMSDIKLVSKQIKFNKEHKELFKTRLGGSTIVLKNDFIRGLLRMVFVAVPLTRPNELVGDAESAGKWLAELRANGVVKKR